MDLAEWLIIYLKHQDMMKKSIRSIEKDGAVVIVEKDSGQEEWLIEEELKLHTLGVTGIVTLNKKKNLTTLIEKWNSITDSTVKIVFVNPKTNEKWLLVPSHHARVADEKGLKAGLQSLFSSIYEV